MAVVKEAAVTVYAGISALLKHLGDAIFFQTCGESCARSVLDTMHWPQRLWQTVEFDLFEHLLSRMTRRKTPVICRMPILRGNDKRKCCLEFVCNRDHCVALRHC